jgi:hypothetical protein
MPLDGSILGNCASEQMEALERDYGDADDVQVATVVTIVEVLKETGTDEQGQQQFWSNVRLRSNTDPYRAIGILEAAIHKLVSSGLSSGE